MQAYSKWIIVIGALIMIIGMVMWFWGDKLRWVGHLPGDIRMEKENFRVYIPLTTMLLVSLLVTLIRWLFRNF